MTFDEYLASITGNKSLVKKKILQQLWGAGTTFPGSWVLTSTLLAATGQKYFDRRIRELRDQCGCDIETSSKGYRLASTRIKRSNPRGYLSATQKMLLFKTANDHCAVCDREYGAGLRGLQADHKVPLTRGGTQEQTNWQALCVECNVGKRRACAGCDLDCQICPWAFPERVGLRLMVQVPLAVENNLKAYVLKTGKTLSECVAEAVTQYAAKMPKV